MILLKERREERNISQQQLSVMSGVPQQTISSIESNKRANPGIETMYLLSVALRCGLNDIYQYTGSPQKAKRSKK